MYTVGKVQTGVPASTRRISCIEAQLQVKHVSTGTTDDQGKLGNWQPRVSRLLTGRRYGRMISFLASFSSVLDTVICSPVIWIFPSSSW